MSGAKYDDAVKAFKKAIALNPERPDAHIKLSAVYVRMEKYKEAVAEGKKAVKCDVVSPETHLALANALLASGDKLAAIEPYETAIQNNFEKRFRNPLVAATALSGLGWAFAVKDAGEKELAEAVNDQRQAIHIFPQFGPAYVRLAELLLRQGKEKQADDVYKLSVKLSNDDAGVSTAYAKFLLKLGRRDEARSVLKNVLEKTPSYKQASDALAELDNERAS
jgi:Tfp pilus assembly protein PilF